MPQSWYEAGGFGRARTPAAAPRQIGRPPPHQAFERPSPDGAGRRPIAALSGPRRPLGGGHAASEFNGIGQAVARKSRLARLGAVR